MQEKKKDKSVSGYILSTGLIILCIGFNMFFEQKATKKKPRILYQYEYVDETASSGITTRGNTLTNTDSGTPAEGGTTGDGSLLTEEERNNWFSSLSNGGKADDGRLTLTTYGYSDDATPDSNTTEKRGFANNLLRPGSVALSPDIYNKYKPEIGAAVYINGTHVGYYEDRTPASYQGKSYGNVIDIYDPNKTLGVQSKAIAEGNYTISFGPARTQIANL